MFYLTMAILTMANSAMEEQVRILFTTPLYSSKSKHEQQIECVDVAYILITYVCCLHLLLNKALESQCLLGNDDHCIAVDQHSWANKNSVYVIAIKCFQEQLNHISVFVSECCHLLKGLCKHAFLEQQELNLQ